MSTRMPTAARKGGGIRRPRDSVVGIRMRVELRTALKVEAAKRGLTIAALFEEMWHLYSKHRSADGH